jgi:hypothetical protein
MDLLRFEMVSRGPISFFVRSPRGDAADQQVRAWLMGATWVRRWRLALAGLRGTGSSCAYRPPALADGGKVQMPLGKTFFSPRFGIVADRFGVAWMVIVPA